MSGVFEAEVSQVHAVRRLVGGAVRGWGIDPADATLVASELATNAVLHARSPFKVTVSWEPGRILIQVADLDPRAPAPARAEPDAPSGRGLEMVEALSAAWGVRSHPGQGKTVWAELGLSDAS